MNLKLIQKKIIVKDLLMIHKSLSKDFLDALEDKKVFFAKHFLGYGSIAIYLNNQKAIYVYAFEKTNDKILAKVENTYRKYSNLFQDRNFEVLINDNQVLINLFLNKNLVLVDSGSEYILKEAKSKQALGDLKVEKYNFERIDEYIDIIDKAFNPLRIKTGEDLNYTKNHYQESLENFRNSALKDNLLIFTKQDQIIGIAMIRQNILDNLVVNPKFQGQGYGSIILSYISDLIINKRAYHQVYSYVITENERVHNFCLKNGYQVSAKYRVLKERNHEY